MRPTARLADGADEWSCPTCGRRIVLRRPPDPGITVLEAGDESAVHIGITEPTAAERAAAEAAERYGLGPVQEIPRPPARTPREVRGTDAPEPATVDAQDRAWLAEIGIDWEGDAAA
ncbi:hypothetical protein [Kitasatospora sp. NPDC085879]|uniref:hypothetical protein n=1 Tax=Kitasatospora sp. NPDC085879 TaxID=3154769 RepID=UPI0011860486|nr:hypothetical protein [Streptomyces sp. TLI_235]